MRRFARQPEILAQVAQRILKVRELVQGFTKLRRPSQSLQLFTQALCSQFG